MKTRTEIAIECGAKPTRFYYDGNRVVPSAYILEEPQLQSFVDAVNVERGLNYEVLYAYAELLEIDYNQLCTTVRLAVSAPQPLVAPDQSTQGTLAVALEALAWCSGHMPNEPVIERAIKKVQKGLASTQTTHNQSEYIKRLEDAVKVLIHELHQWALSEEHEETTRALGIGQEALKSKGATK